MKFKVGDKVKLRKASEFYHESRGSSGVVVEEENQYHEYPYAIRWAWQTEAAWRYREKDMCNGDFIGKYIKKHKII